MKPTLPTHHDIWYVIWLGMVWRPTNFDRWTRMWMFPFNSKGYYYLCFLGTTFLPKNKGYYLCFFYLIFSKGTTFVFSTRHFLRVYFLRVLPLFFSPDFFLRVLPWFFSPDFFLRVQPQPAGKIEQIQSYLGLTLESSIILEFVGRLTCVGQAGYVITGCGLFIRWTYPPPPQNPR